jgi:ABC-type transport system involved in cytochrome c biogenesis permease subunit
VVLGWRGRRAAVLAIVGFALVMFSFIGVNSLLGGHHSFGDPSSYTGPRGM